MSPVVAGVTAGSKYVQHRSILYDPFVYRHVSIFKLMAIAVPNTCIAYRVPQGLLDLFSFFPVFRECKRLCQELSILGDTVRVSTPPPWNMVRQAEKAIICCLRRKKRGEAWKIKSKAQTRACGWWGGVCINHCVWPNLPACWKVRKFFTFYRLLLPFLSPWGIEVSCLLNADP